MFSRETILSLLVAAGGHAAVLFGLDVGSGRTAEPLPEPYIEVSLSAPPGLPNDDSIFATTLPGDSRAPHPEDESVEEPVVVPPLPSEPEPLTAELRPEPPSERVVEIEVPTVPEPEQIAEAAFTVPPVEVPPVIPTARVAVPAPEAVPENSEAPVPAPAAVRETPALASATPSQTRPRPALAGSAGEYHPTDVYFTRQVRPEYQEARKLGQEGLVIVRAFINPRGRTDRVEVAQTSGFPLLDQAACRAAEQSRYRPAYLEKIPVAARVEIPYRFVLTRKESAAVTANR